MKPVTYDFDVITDAPKPPRRAPEAAEQAPQPNADEERRSAAPPERDMRAKPQAAE